MDSDKSSDEANVFAEQTFEFYKKIIKEVNPNGDYVCLDPHEIIIPIDGLILKVGKRKCARIKSNIKISPMEEEKINEINNSLSDILDGTSKKYKYVSYDEEDSTVTVEILK